MTDEGTTAPTASTPQDDQLTYDVVVVGAGAVGENVADRAGRTGLSVVVVEQELVGGECSYWACMPSKAMLRPGAVLAAARAVPGAAEAVSGTIDTTALLARRSAFTSHWDDASQVSWLDGAGIALVRGAARLTGPRVLEVTSDDGSVVTLTARHAVVLATGSEPVIPDIDGLVRSAPWTSREATSVEDVPASLAVLGGGVVGVEMATAFADLGTHVTLIVRGDRVLNGFEPFVSEAVVGSLREIGVDVRLETQVVEAHREDGGVHLRLSTGSVLVAEQVLVATGRRPATADLGLETVGLTAGSTITVDDSLAVKGVADGWLFAAGDVTGRVATTHQGKYQARVVGDVIAARFGTADAPEPADGPQVPGSERPAAAAESAAGAWSRYRATADHAAVPQVVFSRPEAASVGLTESAAHDAGLTVRTVEYALGSVAGAAVSADGYEGTAQIVIDTERGVIVGATFVGPEIAEMLHAATIAVVGEVPIERLWHAVPAYPTMSEVWLRLLETAGL
ncbi:dihydrolipoyl dehydrogenase family protein [Sanguibacter antarcticus]|uniref:Dihydrolipoamide dehydrogenase n=1 Tax=Sanguibacter antarcticus TaxID=372484 RepID=A0A2A9E8D4_9MICO|nr:NAD(P)/FAD-dependent oxidoreductase [Sanguibacter antarcticus]PFG34821.1 dihydrolipoamide dehydrogenase [Sanguibacter antarcticus]